MLTGNLVRVKIARDRVVPLYIDREAARWLEASESLLLLFREGIGMTRGEIDAEVEAIFGGGGGATLVYRGLAKVLEDRAEFEVVADVPPDVIREKVFTAAADYRRQMRASGAGPGHREVFRRDEILTTVAQELNIQPDALEASLFADLRNENRLLSFDDMKAQWLIDRYNVGLAQAVMLRSVLVRIEVRNERPPRYRQLFRRLKFHRLLYRVEGTMRDGYLFQIDGPLNLFSATTKYGLQFAHFLPALLHCSDFRLEAELLGSEARAQELLARTTRRPGFASGRHGHVYSGRAQGLRRPFSAGRAQTGRSATAPTSSSWAAKVSGFPITG